MERFIHILEQPVFVLVQGKSLLYLVAQLLLYIRNNNFYHTHDNGKDAAHFDKIRSSLAKGQLYHCPNCNWLFCSQLFCGLTRKVYGCCRGSNHCHQINMLMSQCCRSLTESIDGCHSDAVIVNVTLIRLIQLTLATGRYACTPLTKH